MGRPLPKWEKGTRAPGSGRVKGTPNKITVEVRTFVAELVTSPTYQQKLRADFDARKLHPTIEAMVWAYYIGKPQESITLTATVDVTARVEEERRLFASLEIHDLEQLAAESQALVDRARALAQVRAGAPTLPDIVVEASLPIVSEETLTIMPGSDKGSSVNQTDLPDVETANPDKAEG